MKLDERTSAALAQLAHWGEQGQGKRTVIVTIVDEDRESTCLLLGNRTGMAESLIHIFSCKKEMRDLFVEVIRHIVKEGLLRIHEIADGCVEDITFKKGGDA